MRGIKAEYVIGIQTLKFSIAQFLPQVVDFSTHFPNNSEQHVS